MMVKNNLTYAVVENSHLILCRKCIFYPKHHMYIETIFGGLPRIIHQ